MKKALLAILIILLAIAVVYAVLKFVPVERKPVSPPVAPPPHAAAAPASRPTKAVEAYLEALYKKDYRTAFNALSADSRKAHPFDEFVKLNEEKGMTQFDLATAKEEPGTSKTAMVSLSLKEDVAQHGFRLVEEGGRWKIVFIKGTPSFPYGE